MWLEVFGKGWIERWNGK